MGERDIEFVCSSCSYTSAKWLGRCPNCGEWNTFVQVTHEKNAKKPSKDLKSVKLKSISSESKTRFAIGIEEFDRVLGGGIVQGALILIGGDPGIGKSTLALVTMNAIARKGINALYVTGEESLQQLKLRANMLNVDGDINVLADTELDNIFNVIEHDRPKVVVIDSIQTMESSTTSAPRGSVAQLKEITDRLMRFSKQNNVSFIIVGHVTKEGVIAGPKLLEHMVDTVLYFEGDRNTNYRILRAIKNRFGSTNEIGVFEMTGTGLIEIKNPSTLFLSDRVQPQEGCSVFAGIEGTRALLVEIQSLVTQSYLAMPRRTTVGVDQTRLSMLVAVLDKKVGLNLGGQDIYVNVVGGVSIDEPASDLSVVSALVSSYKRKPLPSNAVFIGEIGLTGEIRAVHMLDKRLKEAQKLGFKKAYISSGNAKDINLRAIDIVEVKNIELLLELLF